MQCVAIINHYKHGLLHQLRGRLVDEKMLDSKHYMILVEIENEWFRKLNEKTFGTAFQKVPNKLKL